MKTHAPDLTKYQAYDELKKWLRAGFIAERRYRDPRWRKWRLGLFVDHRPL
jgi:hypothetical protein